MFKKGPPTTNPENFWRHPEVGDLSGELAILLSSASHAPADELPPALERPLAICRRLDSIACSMGLPHSAGKAPFPFLSFNTPSEFDTGVCLNRFETSRHHPVVSAVRYLHGPSGSLVLKWMFDNGAPHKPVVTGRVGGNLACICAREKVAGALGVIMEEAGSQGASREKLLETVASWLSGCSSSLSHHLVAEAAPWIEKLQPAVMPLDPESVFNSPIVCLVCRDTGIDDGDEEMARATLLAFLDLAPLGKWSMEPKDEWSEWVATAPDHPWVITSDAISSGSLWAVDTLCSADPANTPPAAEIDRLVAEAKNYSNNAEMLLACSMVRSILESTSMDRELPAPSRPDRPRGL